jgi:hypothetical protein
MELTELTEFFADHKAIVIVAHAIAAAIGLGAATVSDVLFFRFLKDGNITNRETPILDVMTKIMWFAITLLVLTGAMLFLSDPLGYAASSKFIVKMIVVGVIIVNGVVMTKYLHVNMQKLTFTDKYHMMVKKIAFASGAISISSWYLSFILGSIRSIPYDVTTGLVGYVTLVLIAIIASQYMYVYYQKKFYKKNKRS